MLGPHPEYALIVLLLPGTVFCVLMFMERKKHIPRIRLFAYDIPVWAVYVVVFISGPLLLLLMLATAISRSPKH